MGLIIYSMVLHANGVQHAWVCSFVDTTDLDEVLQKMMQRISNL